MDYLALRAELREDPAGLNYAPIIGVGSHNIVAALLNIPRYPRPGSVTVSTVLIWAAKHGILAKLRAAAAGENPQVASIAEVALLLVQNPNIPAIDLALPDVQEMFDVLTAAGVIAVEDRDELFLLGTVSLSRADIIGLGIVREDDVARALAEVSDD